MRSLPEIQAGNRLAAVRDLQGPIYHELINLVGKAKAAGWPEEQYRRAEDLIRKVEQAATGRELTDGVPAGYTVGA